MQFLKYTWNLALSFRFPTLGNSFFRPVIPLYYKHSLSLRSKPPSVHTMPTQFHGRNMKFSKVRKCLCIEAYFTNNLIPTESWKVWDV